MDSEQQYAESPSKDKGKQRASLDVTEQTPLLFRASSSQTPSEGIREPFPSTARRRLLSRLVCVFSISLSICVTLFIILALIAWTYASHTSGLSPEDIIHNATIFQGPSRVDVLNITDSGGIWIAVQGKIGINAGIAAGVNSDPTDGVFAGLWKSLGRWGVKRLDHVSVSLSTIEVTTRHDGSFLSSVELPPVELALSVDPPKDLSWLQDISFTVFVQPTSNSSVILDFLQDSWYQGAFSVDLSVAKVDVRGGPLYGSSWRSNLHRQLSDIRTLVQVAIPSIPGFPTPGRGSPFPPISDLITLQSFGVLSVGDAPLSLWAEATLVDPAPMNLNLTISSLAFVVSLPAHESPPVPIASVSTLPFTFTHPNITLHIAGNILPLPLNTTSLLSSFLTRYLSSVENPITISSPIFPAFSIEAMFPAPHPRPRVLRNVTIHNMKIKPGNTFLASGTVYARVVLPKGMDIDVDVKRILPDVLVFDGEVPDDVSIELPTTGGEDEETKPPVVPLPDPLPERAFGRIRPDEYLNSTCERDRGSEEGEGEGSVFTVSALIVDVPLEVLPGRQKEFGDFVGKIVFSADGAIAGLLGTTSVDVDVRGLPIGDVGKGGHDVGGMKLHGLPFRGSVRISKKNMAKFTE